MHFHSISESVNSWDHYCKPVPSQSTGAGGCGRMKLLNEQEVGEVEREGKREGFLHKCNASLHYLNLI